MGRRPRLFVCLLVTAFQLGTARAEEDACKPACDQLRELAWRRLFDAEVDSKDDAAKQRDLEKRRSSAKENGADQTCLAACRAGKVDVTCVMDFSRRPWKLRVSDEGAPACVRDKALAAAFDESVLAEERATPSGSCDASATLGFCTDFHENSRWGGGKGAACYVLGGAKPHNAPCPRKNMIGTCVLLEDTQQEQHIYFTGDQLRRPRNAKKAAQKTSFQADCKLLGHRWIPAPTK